MNELLLWWDHLRNDAPGLYDIVNHWPVTVYLPIIACGVIALATITSRWDAHDRKQATTPDR